MCGRSVDCGCKLGLSVYLGLYDFGLRATRQRYVTFVHVPHMEVDPMVASSSGGKQDDFVAGCVRNVLAAPCANTAATDPRFVFTAKIQVSVLLG